MTVLERVDAEIDRFWYAKWAKQEAVAAEHAKQQQQFTQVPLSQVPVGVWVYNIVKHLVGVAEGQDTDPRYWKIKNQKGEIQFARNIPVLVVPPTSPVCACEPCEAVRDRKDFLVKLDTAELQGARQRAAKAAVRNRQRLHARATEAERQKEQREAREKMDLDDIDERDR